MVSKASSRTPHGVRGLKFGLGVEHIVVVAGSHPTRGAWIEIQAQQPPRETIDVSHPTRGAWIEIFSARHSCYSPVVAPHTGCVD